MKRFSSNSITEVLTQAMEQADKFDQILILARAPRQGDTEKADYYNFHNDLKCGDANFLVDGFKFDLWHYHTAEE